MPKLTVFPFEHSRQNHDDYSKIVAAVLQRSDEKVLLLKRASNRQSDPDKWCFVTGYVQQGETQEKAVIREVEEELNLKLKPVKKGKTVFVSRKGETLNVYPYLFKVQFDVNLSLNKEHSEFKWIKPTEIYTYDIVQQLDEDLISLGLLRKK